MDNPDIRAAWEQPGLNAYSPGGGTWHYGQQGVNEFLGGLFPVTDDTPPFGMSLLPMIEKNLYLLPLDVLRLFKPFTRGTTDQDWATQDAAVQTILKTFYLKGNPFQEWIDGLVGIFKPGASNQPLEDAIKVILGIKTAAEIAQEHAELALIGVEALKAQQAGGWFDEFDYPIADSLPPGDYMPFYSGGGTGVWGPDGAGRLIYKPRGIGTRAVMIRRETHPIVGANGTVTVVLSNSPEQIASDAYVYVAGKWSATDQSRVQVEIHPTGALTTTCTTQFQLVDAAGGVTNIGSPASNLPKMDDGDVLSLSWVGPVYEFRRNGIVGNSVSIPNAPAGDRVGFGAACPNFLLPPHPAAEFAGLAWHG